MQMVRKEEGRKERGWIHFVAAEEELSSRVLSYRSRNGKSLGSEGGSAVQGVVHTYKYMRKKKSGSG